MCVYVCMVYAVCVVCDMFTCVYDVCGVLVVQVWHDICSVCLCFVCVVYGLSCVVYVVYVV